MALDNGPKISFTDTERSTFDPLFVKFSLKQIDAKGILAALGGSREQFERFKLYAEFKKKVLEYKKLHEASKRIHALEERREILTQSIQAREATIAASREQSATSSTAHLDKVQVTTTGLKY